jgi:hypothetical protein
MVMVRLRNKLRRVVKKAGNLEKCFLVKKIMRMNWMILPKCRGNFMGWINMKKSL